MPSERKQLRVLFHQFLFRMVDLDLLPSPEEMPRLLGQLAALLMAFNFLFARGVARVTYLNAPLERKLAAVWGDEHFFIATTMLSVGMLAVLCWDAMFPDRRDVLVLAPLPVRTRILFAAKIGALALALALTVVSVNLFTGISYPLTLAWISDGGWSVLQWLLAYWVTALAAGNFILGCVLTMQGLISQFLPRRISMRLAAGLQLCAFSLFLGVYFLQPPLSLNDPRGLEMMLRLPSYWFLGMFVQLTAGANEVSAALAERAWEGLAIANLGALFALAYSYERTMKQLVEEPDIVPSGRTSFRLPGFGGSLHSALTRFSFRTLLRSRQHRLIFSLYLGIGLAFALACARNLLYGKSRAGWLSTDGPWLVASLIVLCCAVTGMRVVVTIPIALRANWIFQSTAIRSNYKYLVAIRGVFGWLAVVPIAAVLSMGTFAIWPVRAALVHAAVLSMWAWALVEFCMIGFHKIPFACSYLPGKANVHIRSGACALVLVVITDWFAQWERLAFKDWRQFCFVLLFLGGLVALGRWLRVRATRVEGETVNYDQEAPREIHALELFRDGSLVVE